MKFTLLATAALLLAPISAFAALPSPVGTWEVNLAGADQGIAYVTFEDDHDFTAYGMSSRSDGIFTLSGTWSVDEKGRLSGSYTETIGGENVTGTINGKVTARKLSGRITATNGDFKFSGTPEKATQDLSGSWTGTAALGKLRIPELYQISATGTPHLYQIGGFGASPTGGEFEISGLALAGSKGRVRIFALSEYPWAETPGTTNLSGTISVAKKKGSLRGFEVTGQAIKVSLRR
jgi:hypothetical protein